MKYPLNVPTPHHFSYVVRNIPEVTVEQRERALKSTHYNEFGFPAGMLTVDCLSDSEVSTECSMLSSILSDVDCDAYSLRFPVYRYGDFICIDSEITVFTKTKEIRVDCYDHNTRDCYARWYCRDVGRDETLMTLVTSQVEKKLKSLGIKMELPSNWNILIDESKNIDENFE